MALFGYPIGRIMEEWWLKHGGNIDSPEWHKWVKLYSELLPAKLLEVTEEHDNSVDGIKVFGMSKAGGCTRASALKYLGCEAEPFSGSTKFTFFLGHSVEVMALTTLIMCGYPVTDMQSPITIDSTDGPLFKSAPDGIIKLLGTTTPVSVKSTAYKMSGWRNGKPVRMGFAKLPFEGVRADQPVHYAQSQLEMRATGTSQSLMLYVAKDIVKAFENDDYLGQKGNGSLTFYTELIKYDHELTESLIDTWGITLSRAKQGSAGEAMYLHPSTYQFVQLKRAEYDPKNIWGGKNKEITGTFNPCGGCDQRKACVEYQ